MSNRFHFTSLTFNILEENLSGLMDKYISFYRTDGIKLQPKDKFKETPFSATDPGFLQWEGGGGGVVDVELWSRMSEDSLRAG